MPIFANIKVWLYGIVLIFILGAAWKINSIFDENIALHNQNTVYQGQIADLEFDNKFKEDTLLATKDRLAALEKIQVARKVAVESAKQKSSKYSTDTKTGIDTTISDNTVGNHKISVDMYTKNRYNSILECIEKVTKNEQDNC